MSQLENENQTGWNNVSASIMGTTHSTNAALSDRITDIQNQRPRETNCPIEGLAKTPLMSLNDATAGLKAIIPDIEKYVEYTRTFLTDVPLPDCVSIEGLAAVIIYTIEWEQDKTLSLYYRLNQSLRLESRTSLKPYFPYLKLMLTTLFSLPPYVGPVWRGVRKNMAKEYPKGTRFFWWSFSSCTKDIATLENEKFLGKTGERTLFNIQCKNGREIHQWSAVKREEEIILPPGTYLEVKNCLDIGNDAVIIHIEEIDPDVPAIEKEIRYPNKQRSSTCSKNVAGKQDMYAEIVKGLKQKDVDIKTQELYLSVISTAVQGCDVKKSHTELIDIVIKSLMENSDEGVIEAAFNALASLANTVKNRNIIKNSDGFEKVLEVMAEHYTDEDVLTQGFCLISQFLSDDNETMKNYTLRLLSQPPGLSVIVKALECHQEEPKLIQYVCYLISSISVQESQTMDSFVKNNTVSLLLDVLLSENVTVSLASLKTLRNLTVSEVVRSFIAASSRFNQSSITMEKHAQNEEIQVIGCEVYRNLSANDAIASKVAESGALNSVIRAMKEHEKSQPVQIQGCWALYNFARLPNNCEWIVKQGALDCIVNAMTVYKDVSQIQEKACRALAMICANAATGTAVLRKSLDLVLNAMTNHATDVQVQKNACFALTNLASNDTNKEIIASKNASSLLIKALDMSLATDETLMKFALTALVKLALTATGQKVLIEPKSLGTLLRTIEEVTHHDSIQDVCLILASLCQDKMTKSQITQSAVKTLKSSISRMNDQTRPVAEKLMTVLQQNT